MQDSDSLEILFSKTKILILTAGALVFVALGVFMIYNAENQSRYSPFYMYLVGFVSIVFFGACAFFGFKNFWDTKPGLVLHSEGIKDNINGIEMIPWDELIGFDILQIQTTKFLVLLLKNPEEIIKSKKGFKKYIFNLNYKWYGSPICISSTVLVYNFKKLAETLSEYLDKYQLAKN